MAPPPPIPKGPLPAGQTTIISASNSALSVARPPPTPRPSLKPKESTRSKIVLGRRLIGGPNEQRVLQLFAAFRLLGQEGGELGDEEAISREIWEDVGDEDTQQEEEDEADYILRRRYAYT